MRKSLLLRTMFLLLILWLWLGRIRERVGLVVRGLDSEGKYSLDLVEASSASGKIGETAGVGTAVKEAVGTFSLPFVEVGAGAGFALFDLARMECLLSRRVR